MNLTVDEQQIIAIYYSGSREGTIAAIQSIRGDLEPDETELRELTNATIRKLCEMTEVEFNELNIDLGIG